MPEQSSDCPASSVLRKRVSVGKNEISAVSAALFAVNAGVSPGKAAISAIAARCSVLNVGASASNVELAGVKDGYSTLGDDIPVSDDE